MRLHITLPSDLVALLDAEAGARWQSRSRILEDLLRERFLTEHNRNGPDGTEPVSNGPNMTTAGENLNPETAHTCAQIADRAIPIRPHPIRPQSGHSERVNERKSEGGFAPGDPTPALALNVSQSQLPAEVEALKVEYLDRFPELDEVMRLMAGRRGTAGWALQKAILLELRNKPLKRRIWALNRLLHMTPPPVRPHEYLLTLLENGPVKRKAARKRPITRQEPLRFPERKESRTESPGPPQPMGQTIQEMATLNPRVAEVFGHLLKKGETDEEADC